MGGKLRVLFGRDILVANVLEEGAKTRTVYLPAGCKWYDWNDKFRCYEGGQTIEVPVTMATIPMFVREGAVIAMADNQLMTMEGDHTTALHLIVAPKGTTTTTLYDDDGITNDFKSGVYRKTTITTTAGERVTMNFASEGSYKDTVETIKVEMIAKEKSPSGSRWMAARSSTFSTAASSTPLPRAGITARAKGCRGQVCKPRQGSRVDCFV